MLQLKTEHITSQDFKVTKLKFTHWYGDRHSCTWNAYGSLMASEY